MPIIHHRLAVADATLHYTVAGEGPPLVLIHGFPQTWHQWRPVIERLAGRFRIIAPDLRGIGATPGPATGYDKLTMAGDIRAILEKEVGDTPATVVGHDMGAFVAFAHALRYPAFTSALVLIDAPMSGTALFDQLRSHPRAWHIAFHGARDVAEMLVSGRERAYIAQFVAARIYDASAVTADDIDVYAAAYAAPGAFRAGFEMYRAFDVDVAQHRELLARGKLRMPVAVVGGGASLSGSLLADSMCEFAENGRAYTVERAAHWIPEEQPDRLAEIIAETAAR
jgi:pimeloyl-ACP methyl ester carboxylesterase